MARGNVADVAQGGAALQGIGRDVGRKHGDGAAAREPFGERRADRECDGHGNENGRGGEQPVIGRQRMHRDALRLPRDS
jgi:hypothetical protein